MTTLIDIFPSISFIASPFKGILLDAYGVFWAGNQSGLISGAKEMMEKLVSEGKILGILSNSTQLAANEIHKLDRHGLIKGKHFHFLLTSGEVARHIFLYETLPFKITTKKFWLFGGAHPKYASHQAIFQDTLYCEASDIREADFIYISIPHIDGEDQQDPELFRKELEKIKIFKLPMICPNPDQFAHEGNPPKAVVRQGSIALMYEEMGGDVFYIGKPHQEAFARAMREFEKLGQFNASEILMVGDTPETDIRGAKRFGMTSALVTKQGIMRDRIAKNGLEKALRDLSESDSPHYLLECL